MACAPCFAQCEYPAAMEAYVARDGQLFLDSAVPVPGPGPHQVLVRIKATAVNRADILQRKGLYPPPSGVTEVLGLEASGTVAALGPDCAAWLTPGLPVMALLSGGAYAEFAVVEEGQVMTVPDGMSVEDAAAIPEAFLTAFQLLHFVAHVRPGEHVLIHAGGSGVGTAAVQLAKLAGAIPHVTAGDEAKLAQCLALGAASATNYKLGSWVETVKSATSGHGIDIVLDCIGAPYVSQNTEVLALDGRWVVYGLMGGPDVGSGPFLRALMSKRLQLLTSTLRTRSTAYKAELVAAFSAAAGASFGAGGALKPVIFQRLPFAQVAAAHALVEANANTGKVLIVHA